MKVCLDRGAFDNITNGIILVDDNKTIRYVNKAAIKIFGYRQAELFEKKIAILFQEYGDGEQTVRCKGGSFITVDLTLQTCKVDEQNYEVVIIKSQNEMEMFRRLVQATSSKTGESFFSSLVKYLTQALHVDYAFVCEIKDTDTDTLQSVSRCFKGNMLKNNSYGSSSIVNKILINKHDYFGNTDDEIFNDDVFMGVAVNECLIIPIVDSENTIKGVVGVAHSSSISNISVITSMLKLFVFRIIGELERRKNDAMLNDSRERYREMVECSPDAIFVYSEGKVMYTNKAGLKLLGGESIADIIGTEFLNFIHPDFYKYVKSQFNKRIEIGRETNAFEGKIVRFDRSIIDVEFIKSTLSFPFLAEDSFQIIIRDVTRKKGLDKYDAELSVRKQKSELLKLVRNPYINNGDINKALQIITESAANTLGVERVSIWLYNNDRSLARCMDLYEWSKDYHSIGPELKRMDYIEYFEHLDKHSVITNHDDYTESIKKPFVFPSTTSVLEVPIRSGEEVIGVVSCEHVGRVRQWTFDEQSFGTSIAHMVSLTIEKSNRKQTEKEITHLAYYDQLTNLPNRILLQEELQSAIEKAERDDHMVAVMFFDLDQFKIINDSLGHKFGDALLSSVAERIKSCVRQVDMIGRMGGDEFILILPKIKQSSDAVIVAERITQAFEKTLVIHEQELYVTTSIGISIYPIDGTEHDILIKNADIAMYHAKEKGRNCFEFYIPEMSLKTSEKLLMETNLHRALEKNEFALYYQPIIDLKTNRIIGAEALIRWIHPELGFISPEQFIPLAEITGLIIPIGEWVMRTACTQLQDWREQGFLDLEMSINVSARQLKHGNIMNMIMKVKQDTELELSSVCLEITENIAVESEGYMIELLKDLRNLGIKIAIDDFGKGYSLLSYLKTLPITTLKIDKSFVENIAMDEKDAIMAKMIIDLAHNFNLEVAAEGVEQSFEHELLREWKCERAQGYLFSRPVPAEDFYELLIQSNGIVM